MRLWAAMGVIVMSDFEILPEKEKVTFCLCV
jgi:hypothetical protein